MNQNLVRYDAKPFEADHLLCIATLSHLYVSLYPSMGACGQVDRVLDLRSEGLGFDSNCWSCVQVSGNFSYHIAFRSAHPAVMGTWWNENLENCEWH